MSTSYPGVPRAIWRYVRDCGINTVREAPVGIVFSSLALIPVSVALPDALGYTVFTLVAMTVLAVSRLTSLPEEDLEPPFEVEELTESELAHVMRMMMVMTTAGVSAVVLVGGIGGYAISTMFGFELVGFAFAVAYPGLDVLLVRLHRYLSVMYGAMMITVTIHNTIHESLNSDDEGRSDISEFEEELRARQIENSVRRGGPLL